jgi:hypothetical protein
MTALSCACLLLISVFSILPITFSARTVYGDGVVYLYKDSIAKEQLNIYEGDQFILDFKLRSASVEGYNDISFLNITQNIKDLSADKYITVILRRVENYLFNVTSVSPVHVTDGGNDTVLSRSAQWPSIYATSLNVRNSQNETLALRNIYRIVVSAFRIVSNSGIRVEIFPNP